MGKTSDKKRNRVLKVLLIPIVAFVLLLIIALAVNQLRLKKERERKLSEDRTGYYAEEISNADSSEKLAEIRDEMKDEFLLDDNDRFQYSEEDEEYIRELLDMDMVSSYKINPLFNKAIVVIEVVGLKEQLKDMLELFEEVTYNIRQLSVFDNAIVRIKCEEVWFDYEIIDGDNYIISFINDSVEEDSINGLELKYNKIGKLAEFKISKEEYETYKNKDDLGSFLYLTFLDMLANGNCYCYFNYGEDNEDYIGISITNEEVEEMEYLKKNLRSSNYSYEISNYLYNRECASSNILNGLSNFIY